MSAFYAIHASHEVPRASALECWFPYAKPRDTSEYERAFGGAAVKFGAPFFGFAFNRSYVSAPLAGADPVLHQAHCDRVDSMMVALSDWHAVRGRVRRFIQQELKNTRRATLTAVARAMRMSSRTMSRRLEQEGTTFVDELDHARRELGIAYVAESEASLKEIAFALGFPTPNPSIVHSGDGRATRLEPIAVARTSSGRPGDGVQTQAEAWRSGLVSSVGLVFSRGAANPFSPREK